MNPNDTRVEPNIRERLDAIYSQTDLILSRLENVVDKLNGPKPTAANGCCPPSEPSIDKQLESIYFRLEAINTLSQRIDTQI